MSVDIADMIGNLLEPNLSDTEWSEWFGNLSRHFGCLMDGRERQGYRLLFLRAATRARQLFDFQTEKAFLKLAMGTAASLPLKWLTTVGAIEVLDVDMIGLSPVCSVTDVDVDAAVLRELSAIGCEDVGSDLEPKYRIAGMLSDQDAVSVSLSPTSWHLGKNFHIALKRNPCRFLRDGKHWIVPLPLGQAQLPGLAVVHAIVLTSDSRLLMAQRGPKVSYAPLHWSASFEEQVTDLDMRDGDMVFHAAARRGMLEEFGIKVGLREVSLVSFLLETDSLNLAAVALIRVDLTLDQIRSVWLGPPRPSHAWEAVAVDGVLVDVADLDAMAADGHWRLGALHPTSPLRCAMLARRLRAAPCG